MSKNTNLHNAKTAKNDEFYTQATDIEKELKHYKKHFEGKIIFCNCDDPTWSEFWRYFHLNFAELKLKKLISTHYDAKEPTYKLEYLGGNDNDIEDGIKTPLLQNGDFRCDECIEILKEADIVVTNPPFSLFRPYIAQLMKYNKKFIIIGNKNAITYKDFFPFLKNNEIWIGYNNVKSFMQPDNTMKKFGNIGWFTNLDIPKRHEDLDLWKTYNPEEFPKYDNYDAINCDKVSDIPIDYFESWGVPKELYELLNKGEWEITRQSIEKDADEVEYTYYWIIPAAGTSLRKQLSEHSSNYKENIENILKSATYCNGEIGCPITIMDSLNPEQMEIVGADFEIANPVILDNGKKGTGRFYVSDSLQNNRTTEQQNNRTTEQQNNRTREEDCTAELLFSTNYKILQRCHWVPDYITGQIQYQSDNTDWRNRKRRQGLFCRLMARKIKNCSAVNQCEQKIQKNIYKIQYCNGVIGVPITYLDKHNVTYFQILNALNRYLLIDENSINDDVKTRHSHCCNINNKPTYYRILIQRKL